MLQTAFFKYITNPFLLPLVLLTASIQTAQLKVGFPQAFTIRKVGNKIFELR